MGSYNEEEAKLLLRGYSKEKKKDVMLGFVGLKLHTLAMDRNPQHLSFKLTDSRGREVGTVKASVTVRHMQGPDSQAKSPMKSRIQSPTKTATLNHGSVYRDSASNNLYEDSCGVTDQFRSWQVNGRPSPTKQKVDSPQPPLDSSASSASGLPKRVLLGADLKRDKAIAELTLRATNLEAENLRLQSVVDAISDGISESINDIGYFPEPENASNSDLESDNVIERVGILKAQKIAIEEKLRLLKAQLDNPNSENVVVWKNTIAELGEERKKASKATDRLAVAERQHVDFQHRLRLYEAKIAEMDGVIDSFMKKLAESRENESRCQDTIEALNADLERSMQLLSARDAEIALLQCRRTSESDDDPETARTVDFIRWQLTASGEEVARLTLALAAAATNAAAVESRANERVQGLTFEIESLQEDLAEYARQSVSPTPRATQSTPRSTEPQIDDSLAEKKALEADLRRAREQAIQLRASTSAKRAADNAAYEDKISELEGVIHSFVRKLQEARAAEGAAVADVEHLRSLLVFHATEKREVGETLQRVEAEAIALRASLNACSVQVSSSSAHRVTAEDEICQLRGELERVRAELVTIVTELEYERRNVAQEKLAHMEFWRLDKLEKSSIDQARTEAAVEIAKLGTELEQVRAQVRVQGSTQAEYAKAMDTAAEIVQEHQVAMAVLETRNETLAAEIERLQSEQKEDGQRLRDVLTDKYAAEQREWEHEVEILQEELEGVRVNHEQEVVRCAQQRQDVTAELTVANATATAATIQCAELRAELSRAHERAHEKLVHHEEKLGVAQLSAEAEMQRTVVLENSKSQIAVAELRLAFSEERRKLKEEMIGLTNNLSTLEAERSEAKKENSFLLRKVLQLESENDRERTQHDEQVVSLLKAIGIYDPSKYDPRNRLDNNHANITWAELCRKQLDEERIRIGVLKAVLMRFSPKLTHEDNHALLRAGIILVAGL